VIRAVLLVGWLGLALAVAASWTGYRVVEEEHVRPHMTGALFAAATLLLADLCVLLYLLLTRRMVRRTVEALGLPAQWAVEQRRLAARGAWPALAAAALLVVLFGSGFPTFARSWPPLVHHLLAWSALAAQLVFLLVAAPTLRQGEARLAALGEEVERVRYTPPPDAAPLGPPPPRP
jgi:hypothetical protein